MSELALKRIAENKAKHARGEDASYLDLGRCGLTSLPNLSDMYWLETLILSNRWWDWDQRKWVDCANKGQRNLIRYVENGLFPISLRILLSGGDDSQIWQITGGDFLKGLVNLRTLDLSNNLISNGDFLEDLINLQHLDLSNNQIRKGEFLKRFTNLQSLYISYNRFEIWDFLIGLPNLRSLVLRDNRIRFGGFLKNLTNLQSLDLRNNQIIDADFLSELTNLKSLDLGENQIISGDFLKELPNLQSLNLNNNQFRNADFLSGLTNLQFLDLSNNRISNGDFLESLTNLQSIYLRENRLSSGDFLEGLVNLQSLDLSSNQITDWRFLKGLVNLESLDLNSCQLINADFLQGLTHLQSLDLGYNQIGDGEFLKYLTNLVSLKISNNQIGSGEFLKGLTHLQYLDLGYNQISNGEFLSGLINLKSLKLGNNQISSLEPFMHLIQNGIKVSLDFFGDGQILHLHNNPITHPPLEIVEQGNEAIIRFFEDLKKEGEDQIYEAKLLLIGEGGAGKTTLCRKLFDPNADLPHEKDRTQGIDIHPLYFDLPGKNGKQFRLNIWDFAGQGKYQSAHSFFYTHRSLYVLVDDTRTLNENDAYRTLYNNWLQTAELFGGKSPLLVLHNEKEGCARTGFSLGGFQERFGFVHGELFRINLGGGEIPKLAKLKNRIQELATELPHIGDTVPKTWVKVREAIEKEKADHAYISVERYRDICESAGIDDPKRQSDLSHYFHDLGVFLHFHLNPLLKRDVFLQNTWVTDAVYKILDDVQIAGEQRGRFDKRDLARLWDEKTYRDRRDELLALMLQFELCYQVQDSETYICPQLLPGDIPKYNLGKDIPLQLKYEYQFMPKGLLYRLIVRLHRHIAQGQTAVWSSGVVLERTGSQADIIESLDRRTISIRATGLRAKELVTIINEEVERLHAPFGDRLKVAVKIPCNCSVCKSIDKPHFYDKTNLDNRLSKGKMTVECDVSFEEVNVVGLLEGVFAKGQFFTPDDIKKLFAKGKTEAAIDALCELNYPDALAMKARYAHAQKEHSAGRLTYDKFEEVVNQLNKGGLDMLEETL